MDRTPRRRLIPLAPWAKAILLTRSVRSWTSRRAVESFSPRRTRSRTLKPRSGDHSVVCGRQRMPCTPSVPAVALAPGTWPDVEDSVATLNPIVAGAKKQGDDIRGVSVRATATDVTAMDDSAGSGLMIGIALTWRAHVPGIQSCLSSPVHAAAASLSTQGNLVLKSHVPCGRFRSTSTGLRTRFAEPVADIVQCGLAAGSY